MSVVPDTSASARHHSHYIADANECIHLRLVYPSDLDSPPLPPATAPAATGGEAEEPAEIDDTFHPTFTYPFFGDDQLVLGYKNPRIELRLACASLCTYLHFTYDDKEPANGTGSVRQHDEDTDEDLPHRKRQRTAKGARIVVEDDEDDSVSGNNVEEPLKELVKLLPRDTITDLSEFERRVKQDEAAFVPPGRKVHTYEVEEDDVTQQFELFHCTWDTPGFDTFYDRLRILPVFFIEAAEALPTDDKGWEFVLLFGKMHGASEQDQQYYFIGMCSLYTFFVYPDLERKRISQLLILPPYQGHGHGQELYRHTYNAAFHNPRIAQFAVEDPSYAFDTLRDCCDLEWLLEHGGVAAIPEVADVYWRVCHSRLVGSSGQDDGDRKDSKAPPQFAPAPTRTNQDMALHDIKMAKVRGLRAWMKLSERQAERVYEMALLKALKGKDTKRYRLMVKARIYRINKEGLKPVPRVQRIQQIDDAYRGVLDEYRAVIQRVD
ncbi:histone acetyltransferase 1 [Sorochytrium milnesiophthora]